MQRILSVRDCNCVRCGAIKRRNRQALAYIAVFGTVGIFYLLLLIDAVAN